MPTLSDHLSTLRRLLHDASDVYWSQSDKTAYINQALRRRDLDTGGRRRVISFDLTTGTASYTFTTVGDANIFDVVSITLIYGTQRIVLGQLPYTTLTAAYRSPTGYQSTPVAWARHGASTVYFGPTPSQAFTTEWDVCVFSADLVATTDLDALPYPYTEPVPYYAAYLAKVNERQYDEAEDFLSRYLSELQVSLHSRSGMVPSLYAHAKR